MHISSCLLSGKTVYRKQRRIVAIPLLMKRVLLTKFNLIIVNQYLQLHAVQESLDCGGK